jgi:hypothetical protein
VDAFAGDVVFEGGGNAGAKIVYFGEAACYVVVLSDVFAACGIVFAYGAAKLVVVIQGAYTTGVCVLCDFTGADKALDGGAAIAVDVGDDVAVGVVLATFVDFCATLAGDAVGDAVEGIIDFGGAVAARIDDAGAVVFTVVFEMNAVLGDECVALVGAE